MPIHFGPMHANPVRDLDAAMHPADRHHGPSHGRASPTPPPAPPCSRPLRADDFGPVDSRFAHLAPRPTRRDGDDNSRRLREGPSGVQASGAVRMSAAEQRELAQRYAPVRYLHPDEKNFPGNPQTFLEQAKPVRDGSKVRLDLPDKQRRGNVQDAPTFYQYDSDSRTMTYWYFYPNNDAPGPWFDHEGDWERVEIQFNQDMAPTAARYSNHETHNTYAWDTLPKENGRPVVYVAKGTHANSAYEGQHAPPNTPAFGGRDEFAEGTRVDSADDLHPLDEQPWTNAKLEAQFGADKVLWGGTAQDGHFGPEWRPSRTGLPGVALDTTLVHGDSPDGPERPPYARADVGDLAEDILLVGKERLSGDDDHKRLTALGGELLASEGDPNRRAQLVGELLQQDDGAFGSWLKEGIADDLVRDGRITPQQRELIRDSVAEAVAQGLIEPKDPGRLPGGW